MINSMSCQFNEARLLYIKQSQATQFPQGSTEWFECRKVQFGGSEVAAVLGASPYKTPNDLIHQKIKPDLTPKPACAFGRLFEHVAKKYMRQIGRYVIHDFSCIKSSEYPVAYSPDGIIETKDQLILLEIKCPSRRKKIHTIPKDYYPQIQAGLNILPVDLGLFVQFRFKICRADQYGDTPEYNRYFHMESRIVYPPREPITWGYIEFRTPHTMFRNAGNLNKGEDLTLCLLNTYRINRIVFKEPIRPARCTTILPFKLFDESYLEVPIDRDYLYNHRHTLFKEFSKLLEANDSPVPIKPCLENTQTTMNYIEPPASMQWDGSVSTRPKHPDSTATNASSTKQK